MVKEKFKSTLLCCQVYGGGGGCVAVISAGYPEPLPEPTAGPPSGSAAKWKFSLGGWGGGRLIIDHCDNNENVELVVPCGNDLMYVKWNYILYAGNNVKFIEIIIVAAGVHKNCIYL